MFQEVVLSDCFLSVVDQILREFEGLVDYALAESEEHIQRVSVVHYHLILQQTGYYHINDL